jgi:tRNA-Thr(GGU) m(6)t(6)A37 methyltransferase TsaA
VTSAPDAQLPERLPGLVVIGVVRSAYRVREDTPVQSSLNRSATGTIELAPAFSAALDGLAEFDFAWVITWLSPLDEPPSDAIALRQVPFLLQGTGKEVGVLATRGPRRINPLGLSLVRVLEVGPSTVRFAGVDMVDGTPVVDLKPFVARFDRPEGPVACGWFDTVELADGSTPSSLDPSP